MQRRAYRKRLSSRALRVNLETDAIASELFGGRNRVPFGFRWIDGHMIVTDDYATSAMLSPGDEVLSIVGTTRAILAQLLPYARADGANDAKRIDQLQVRGGSRYEAFEIYFALAFPKNAPSFDLRVRSFGSRETRSFTVAAQSDSDRAARGAALDAAEHGAGPLWSFARLDARTAMLRMPTWVTYNSTRDRKGFLDSTFAELDRGNDR